MKAACIIPCFNLGQYLDVAITSAVLQYRKFDEILVVDDGSTDNTRDICDNMGVECLELANHGYAAARNAGVMNTSSEVILFLDADDWLYPNFLERTSPELEASDVGVVCSQVEADGVTVDGGVWPAPVGGVDIRDLRYRNNIWVSSLIRRSAFLETGGFIPRLEPAADWGLWVDIVQRGWRVVGIPETLWHWRDRPEGLHMLIDPGDIAGRMKRLYPHLYDA